MFLRVLAGGTELCSADVVPRMAAVVLKLQGNLPPAVGLPCWACSQPRGSRVSALSSGSTMAALG